MSASNDLESKIADLAFNAVAYSGFATWYVKLHVGDPGENCTANPAAETNRKAVTFGAQSGGVVTSNNTPTWPAVAASETYSHISLWDAPVAGNPGPYGALTAPVAMTAGLDFDILSGSLTVAVT